MRPSIRTGLALVGIAACIVASRALFLTSSTNMWDSCAFIGYVRTMLDTGDAVHFGDLQTGHPLYLQLGALTTLVLQWLGQPRDVAFAFKVVGIAAVATSVWPMFWLARRLLGETRDALVACAFYALIPLLWWWSGEVMSDAIGAVALVWVFGLAARWSDDGHGAWLVAAMLAMGASILVRFSNIALVPLAAAVVLLGARRRRSCVPLFALAWIGVPIVGIVAWEYGGRPLVEWRHALSASAAIGIEGRALDAARWATIGERVLHGIGWAGVVAGALGFVAATVRRPALAAFGVAWLALVLGPQLVVHTSFLRYWLPIVPIVALWMAAAVATLGPLGVRAPYRAFAIGGLAGALVLAALPDLVTLHTRKNALDAIAEWMRDHTEPDAVFVGETAVKHVETLAGRDWIWAAHDFYEWPFLATVGACSMSDAVLRVDTAIRAGRAVYACDLFSGEAYGSLRGYFEPIVAARLDGAGLRNIHDGGFTTMGEAMRKTNDIHVYRLEPRTTRPRFVAGAVDATPDGWAITATDLRLAGCTAAGIVAPVARPVDWTAGGLDPHADGVVLLTRCPVAPDGHVRVAIPASQAMPGGYAAILFLRDGIPTWITPPIPIPPR